MGRRRDWQDTDLSRAWRTFLMGPRPPSVRWPRSWEQRGRSSSAVQSHSRTRPQQSGPKTRQSTRAPPADPPKQSERQPRGSPDDRVADAQARVIRLQAAVDLLGEDPDAASLKTMLAEAKAQTRVAPVRERLDACLKFIERAKKRLESAEQDVIKAQEVRASRETELSEGLANLQRLRSEATSVAPVPPVAVGGVADAADG